MSMAEWKRLSVLTLLGGLLEEGLNPMDGIHSQYWRGPWAEGARLSDSARRDQDSHAECHQEHKIAESTDS